MNTAAIRGKHRISSYPSGCTFLRAIKRRATLPTNSAILHKIITNVCRRICGPPTFVDHGQQRKCETCYFPSNQRSEFEAW